MKFRHLNDKEEQRWGFIFLIFLNGTTTSSRHIWNFLKFKRKFKGPGWYDLHFRSVPKFLKKELKESSFRFEVIDHVKCSNKDGCYKIKFSGDEKEGILNVDYFTEDYFRTSITIKELTSRDSQRLGWNGTTLRVF